MISMISGSSSAINILIGLDSINFCCKNTA
jgi:hypothetical protein